MGVISLLAIVLAALTLPQQTATAAPGPGHHASLSVSKRVLTAGERVTFTGRLTVSAGRRVELQRRAQKGWVRVDRTMASRSGQFRFARRAPAHSASYRVRAVMSASSYRGRQDERITRTTPERMLVVKSRGGGSGPKGSGGTGGKDSGTVLFSDGFKGASVYDHSKWTEWSPCTYNGTAAYGSIGCGDRAHLDGRGHLVIPATPTQGTSISTKDTFRSTYGTFTARIKVPKQSGYWPAFWTLNSTTDGQPTDGLVGEADAMEAFTAYDDGYRAATHHYSTVAYGGVGENPLCGGGKDIRGSWHDYAARIEPNRITFLFDGEACWTFDKADLDGIPYAFGPDHLAGNFMLLTNAVGNSSQGMAAPTQSSQVLVDKVTVTALK